MIGGFGDNTDLKYSLTVKHCSSDLTKSAKLKRYEQRIYRYKVNRLFQHDQKRVYQEMNGTSSSFSEVRPEAGESQQFWRNIWGKDVLYNGNAEWLKELKKERVEVRQEDIVITAGMVTARSKKIPDWDRTWQWIANGDLKGCTEALICSAQEQALRTNYTRFHIDHTAESPLCRMCGRKGETVAHLVSECSKLAH